MKHCNNSTVVVVEEDNGGVFFFFVSCGKNKKRPDMIDGLELSLVSISRQSSYVGITYSAAERPAANNLLASSSSISVFSNSIAIVNR